MKRIAILAVLLGLAALVLAVQFIPPVTASTGDDQGATFTVINRDAVAYGRTYGDWNAAWEQWADSIPTANHPLFDNGDCSVGQSGPVWFLGGKFCALGATNCGTTNVVRSCKVPHGKALYVAVLNSEYSTLEAPTATQIADLRILAQQGMDGAAGMAMEVDGAPIQNLQERFRVPSTAFGFTLPDDNFFTAVGEGPFTAGDYFPAVDDGVYVMLAPLPIGHHTIHFRGSFPAYSFTLDITYHIYVYH